MLAKFSAAAVALAASSLVSAQTSTKCDPRKGSCPDDPAFGGTVECDFTEGACPAFRAQPGSKVEYTDKGAVFTIKDAGDGPTIISDRYLFHGKVEVELQAAPGQGIVSSVVLLSDDLDEIDFEWIGSKGSEVQSNYFSKGAGAGYKRSVIHPIGDTLHAVRKYGIEWSNQSISWSVDGKELRTLQAAAAQGGPSGFPQTPMFIKLGIWVGGGPESNEGTKEWAGGSVDFSQAPFTAVYKSIKIVDLGAQGSDKVYRYSDRSGNAGSITIGDAKGKKGGQGSNGGSSHNESTDDSSSTDGPSATSSPSPKSSGIGETSDDGDKPQPGTNMTTTGGSGSSVTSGPSSVPAGSAGSGASVPTAAAGSLSRRDFSSFGAMVAATAAVVALLLP